MKNTPLLSVVVPIYNAESHLQLCIESILNQDYQNIELLLINDGSTDSSSAICRSYLKDARVRYISKTNGGVSSARNLGIDKSTGSYITFVDSDDYLFPGAYSNMMRHIGSGGEIICCGLERETGPEGITSVQYQADPGTSYSCSEALIECLLDRAIGFNVYTKIFDRIIFDKPYPVRFPEGCLMEEAQVLPDLFSRAVRIEHSGTVDYCYKFNEGSYTTRLISEDCYFIYKAIHFYKTVVLPLYPEIQSALARFEVISKMNLVREAFKARNQIDDSLIQRVCREFESTISIRSFNYCQSHREILLLLQTCFIDLGLTTYLRTR